MHDPRRRIYLLAGGANVTALFVLAILRFGFGARLDAPTIALAVVAAALVYALGQLYAMVWALSRPDRVAQVGQAAGSFTQAELRDEKRRLLRAIKELEFDFGMGKLSKGDFDNVIATYRLRAIEVMRALEGGALHPDLAKLLAEREAARSAPAEAPAATDADRPRGPLDDTTRICGSCGGTNEADARFCKFCGTAMKKLDGTAVAPVQTPVAGEVGGAP
ncbi:MAG TPA: hypothetical protein VGB85_28330 [Nannocystis sp.]